MSAHAVIAALKRGLFDPAEKIIHFGFNRTHLISWGTAKPEDGSAGYSPGGLFFDHFGKVVYINLGTKDACSFVSVTQATSLAAAIAAAVASYLPLAGGSLTGFLNLQYGTVAAAGANIGNATAIITQAVLVTAADGAKGVKLPAAAAGKIVLLKNDDAANAILKVYPAAAGSTINALGDAGSLDMAAKTSAIFMGTSATHWITIPLLPS